MSWSAGVNHDLEITLNRRLRGHETPPGERAGVSAAPGGLPPAPIQVQITCTGR